VNGERSEYGTGGGESQTSAYVGAILAVALQGLNKVCCSALAELDCLSPACRQSGQTGSWRYVLPPVPLRSTDGYLHYAPAALTCVCNFGGTQISQN